MPLLSSMHLAQIGTVSPGEFVQFAIQSDGLPTIREGLAHPSNFSSLPNFEENEMTEEEYFSAVEAANYHFVTIGPIPPPAAFTPNLFVAEIINLRSRAEFLGWVKPGPALRQVDSFLTKIETSIDQGNLARARQLVQQALAEVENNACRELACTEEKSLSAEAYALLAINLRFLLERLPAAQNTAPVAEAGADRIVQCTTVEQTSVQLDGTGSSDAEGDALAYEWSGAFGSADGEKL
jgi:hypothetical protein